MLSRNRKDECTAARRHWIMRRVKREGGQVCFLQTMPTKMDQGNRKQLRQIVRVGKQGEAFCRAIIDILRGDMVGGIRVWRLFFVI